LGYNISDVSGNFTGTTANGLDGWSIDADLSNPSLSIITGDFDSVTDGVSNGEAPSGYSFSALSDTSYGTLTSVNTTDGTFTFTINRAAVLASGSDQTVSFTITGGDGFWSDEDTITINLLICVATGTMIRTETGLKPVEDLRLGDQVWTLDDGWQPIRWIGSRRIGAAELDADPDLRPIRIKKGALGDQTPDSDLFVSPQHRVLLTDWRAQLLFGEDQVLVPAKGLVNDHSIGVDHSPRGIEYFHILFDRHQIIETAGALTESFCPGPYSLREIDAPARRELFRLFPELAGDDTTYGPAARCVLKMQEARMLGAMAT